MRRLCNPGNAVCFFLKHHIIDITLWCGLKPLYASCLALRMAQLVCCFTILVHRIIATVALIAMKCQKVTVHRGWILLTFPLASPAG